MSTALNLVIFLLAALSAAPANTPRQTQRPQTQLRDGPGSYYPLLAVIGPAQPLEVLGSERGWVSVKVQGLSGWMALAALTSGPPAQQALVAALPMPPKASATAVAAAIRGFGARFGKVGDASLGALQTATEKSFTPKEFAAFQRETAAELGSRPSAPAPADLPALPDYDAGNDEAGLGLGLAARMVAAGLVQDPALVRYVNLVGQRLVEEAAVYAWPFHFLVLDDARVNAFAVPGGYIFVTRGALRLCADEAELAGLIGHEIAHVVLRHGQSELRARKVQGKADAALAELEESMPGDAASAATTEELNEFAEHAYAVVQRPRTDAAEAAADAAASVLLWRAGYDAAGLVRLVARVAEMPTGKDFFASELTTPELTRARLRALQGFVTERLAPFNRGKRFEARFHRTVAKP